jgi:catechol 1,2-dioxygenase
MQRRSFLKNAAFGAVAVSTSGFIHFDGQRYVGDCETTTDIIGPFYRPDSPVRNNLIIKGEPGVPVELSGIVKHIDCVTPYKNAKIELWHCNNNGLYDNTSAEYRYRGTVFSDEGGHYSFSTILPIPYNAAGGKMRPAHFHLMITAEGYQPLITQLYFTGDPFITKDPYSNSPNAKRRILDVHTAANGMKKVEYNISMAEKHQVEPASLEKLAGIYTLENNDNFKREFFVRDHVLWYKSLSGKNAGPFGNNLEYIGNNTFQLPAVPSPLSFLYVFEISGSGAVKCTLNYHNEMDESGSLVLWKGR